jgi:thermitase
VWALQIGHTHTSCANARLTPPLYDDPRKPDKERLDTEVAQEKGDEGMNEVAGGRGIALLVLWAIGAALALALAYEVSFGANDAYAQATEGQRPPEDQGGATEGSSAKMVPGQFVIKFEPGTPANKRQQVVQEQGGRIFDRNTALGVEAVEFPALKAKADARTVEASDRAVEARLTSLESNPHIEYAEPNYVYTVTYTPSDPRTTRLQWAWGKINAYTAWSLTRGSSRTTIAIVDTGINSFHEDYFFSSNCFLGGCWPDPSKFKGGFDAVDNDTNPNDEDGHGTAVAGPAAAVMNNRVGGTGLCPACSLMAIRVGGINGFRLYDIMDGITFAADHNAQVINLSLGGPDYSEALKGAVDYAWNKGAFLACGAGNNGTSALVYPAAYEHCFAVAATNRDDGRAYFSTYGSWVEVAAPGASIDAPCIRCSPPYYSWDGTSFAAPHVAGLAGLLSGRGLTNQQIWNRICWSADDISGTGTYWSCGRINAGKAVNPAGF